MASEDKLAVDRISSNSGPYYNFLDKGHPADYRGAEIQKLLQAIRSRENRLVLGLPGMGISNLLRFLVSKDHGLAHEVTFAYLDCDTVVDVLDLDAFFELIAGELYHQGLGGQLQPADRGYQQLRALISSIGGSELARVVVVVDQADRLLLKVDKTFYRMLKALTNLNKRLCYIFAANPCLADIIDPDNLLFAGRRIPVGRLNSQDLSSAIAEEARRLGATFDAPTHERLARLTAGHPGLLRAVSSAVAIGQLEVAGPEMVVVKRLLARDEIRYRCQKIWASLDTVRQAALRILVSGHSGALDADSLKWLQSYGLLANDEDSSRLFSPVFEHYIAEQVVTVAEDESETVLASAARLGDNRLVAIAVGEGGESTDLSMARVDEPILEPVTIERPTFNAQGVITAGTVLKGNIKIHVSPSELKLIYFLMQERKIRTKDDISMYVYNADPETTESAIENLVHQVRTRLGSGYIKTHWGQGYEFMG